MITGAVRSATPVAVIGGAGFIGRNVVAALSAARVQPSVFTRDLPFSQGDRLHRALLGCQVIYYVAGSSTPATAEQEPRQVAGDLHHFTTLLRGLQDCDHRPLVVLASSGGTVYDPEIPPPYREDHPTRPVTAYGRAKLTQEQRLLASPEWTVPVVLRFANLYGPGQQVGGGFGVVAHWVRAVLADQPVRMIGRSRRDYLHIHDASAALLAVCHQASVLRARGTATVLNIGSGAPTSLDELHGHLEHALGRTIPVCREPARNFDRADVWLDVEAARHALGWQPRIDLASGLAETLAAASPWLRSGAGGG